jgi:hypothetical protein
MRSAVSTELTHVTDVKYGRLAERMMILASGCLIAAAMALLDDRVRERIAGLLTGTSSTSLDFAVARVQRAARPVSEMLMSMSSDPAMPMLFVGSSVVLLVFMLRE